jgi:hypothetical protein
VNGRRLHWGTYLIRARSKHVTVFVKAVVIGRSAPANVCATASSGSSAAARAGGTGGTAANGTSSGSGGKPDRTKDASNRDAATGEPRSSGVLGAHASRILPGSGETQLALLIVLGAAIFLLGLGALPRQVVPHSTAAAFIVRQRPALAAAGFAALGAFVVAYFVT